MFLLRKYILRVFGIRCVSLLSHGVWFILKLDSTLLNHYHFFNYSDNYGVDVTIVIIDKNHESTILFLMFELSTFREFLVFGVFLCYRMEFGLY